MALNPFLLEYDQHVLATVKMGGLYIVIHLMLGVVTTFTSRMSPLRVLTMVAILGLAVCIQIAAHHTTQVPIPVRGILAMGAWIQVFNSLDILLHSRISYTEHVKWKKGRESASFGDAIWFALTLPSNFRRLDTKWQIAVYRFDSTAGRVCRKSRFVQQGFQSIFYVLCIAVLQFLVGSYLHRLPNQGDLFSLLEQNSLLSIRSGESFLIHAHISFFFITTLFLLLKAVYTILAVIAVLFNVSSPAQWPPFQGSVREACSVRRFWRWVPTKLSDQFWIVRNCSVLGLHPGTITSRYVRYLSCFLISGLIHLFFDLAIGIPLNKTGALVFFPVQPLAFALEDVAGALSKRYPVLEGITSAKRLIGYVWVLLFCLWSWRPWAYPILKRSLEIGEPITSTYFHVKVS
ncbi:hypothetical protein BDV38DRAFT_280277 [Aspergillus pseudotamarii]|uniref:Wax synthase domain-containing protein n=1 Tax=Aspergillus pseudotamarii TaxID=132259 RepID=A0A5N6T1X0_ASPPS|nr:uncharacterized protein BDV38DRAFT_280277 [Aspergillus pseudotamarii]KAE8140280.1 hypothetical protein BDV38DRAFT_280277 [Aspergillus pseudotamarii]